MQYPIPMTDQEVEALADEYLKNHKVRAAMEALGMTRDGYIAALRRMYPYPTRTNADGTGWAEMNYNERLYRICICLELETGQRREGT